MDAVTTTEIATRHRMAHIATSMLEGELDLLAGCRALVRLRGSLSASDMSDPDVLVFVAVESELDDIPLGPERLDWAPDALAVKDKEKVDYLDAMTDEILRACSALVTKWTPNE